MPLPEGSSDAFCEAVDLFDSRVAGTAPDSWSKPSPCEGWAARDVLDHLVRNLRGLRAAVEGGDFLAAAGQPVEGDLLEVWDQERRAAPATVGQAALAETLVVGGNRVPPVVLVDGLMRDLVIHTWDLARAVGGDERLPDDLVAAATRAMAMVTAEARGPGRYGHEVPAPPGADAQARLLALSGRSPS